MIYIQPIFSDRLLPFKAKRILTEPVVVVFGNDRYLKRGIPISFCWICIQAHGGHIGKRRPFHILIKIYNMEFAFHMRNTYYFYHEIIIIYFLNAETYHKSPQIIFWTICFNLMQNSNTW